MTKKILIAHFNEDLNWSNNLNFDGDVIVYSKTNKSIPERYVDINKSQEVPMYLKYIIDNYHNLPDKTLFLHGHSNSIHQDYPSRFICENVKWETADYFSVNKRDWYQEVSNNYQAPQHNWLKVYWYLFDSYLPFPTDGVFFYSGAQFVVDKKLILQYPKSFYEKLYVWSITENINIPPQTSDEISSRILEYTWHYIFTKSPIETKLSNEQLF